MLVNLFCKACELHYGCNVCNNCEPVMAYELVPVKWPNLWTWNVRLVNHAVVYSFEMVSSSMRLSVHVIISCQLWWLVLHIPLPEFYLESLHSLPIGKWFKIQYTQLTDDHILLGKPTITACSHNGSKYSTQNSHMTTFYLESLHSLPNFAHQTFQGYTTHTATTK